jgi:hypothetical protein
MNRVVIAISISSPLNGTEKDSQPDRYANCNAETQVI